MHYCFALFLAHEGAKRWKRAPVQGSTARRNSIRHPSKERKWRLWFIHKTGFFCQGALDDGRSPRGNNSAEKSKEQIKPKMRACSMLRQVGQVDRAAALNSAANMKNFSQRWCFPSARLLPWCLHLFHWSSFSFMASSQLLVSYNLTLLRLQCLHQAAVRLHQRVKVTTLSCFAGLPQCRSPNHNLCRSRRTSAAPERRALHLSRPPLSECWKISTAVLTRSNEG